MGPERRAAAGLSAPACGPGPVTGRACVATCRLRRLPPSAAPTRAWPAIPQDAPAAESSPSDGYSWERPATAVQPQATWAAAPDPTTPAASVGPAADRSRLVLGLVAAVVIALLAGGIYLLTSSRPTPRRAAPRRRTPARPPPTRCPTAAGPSGAVIDRARVGPLQPVSVRATCQADPGVDSAGTTITYEPDRTLDAVPATAWRCPGSAVGHQLVYDFGGPVTLAAVGLVPGYAKIDPADGSDRFAENRTVTAVTWRFDDGSSHRQAIAGPGRPWVTVDLPQGGRPARSSWRSRAPATTARSATSPRSATSASPATDQPVRKLATAPVRASATRARPASPVRSAASSALRRLPASSMTAGTSDRLRVPRSVRSCKPSRAT